MPSAVFHPEDLHSLTKSMKAAPAGIDFVPCQYDYRNCFSANRARQTRPSEGKKIRTSFCYK